MTCDIAEYLNQVRWATITMLTCKFNLTRHEVTLILAQMLADQDVRIYGGEVVHI